MFTSCGVFLGGAFYVLLIFLNGGTVLIHLERRGECVLEYDEFKKVWERIAG